MPADTISHQTPFRKGLSRLSPARLLLALKGNSILALSSMLVLLLFLLSVTIPGPLVAIFSQMNAWIYKYFGWFYLVLVLLMLILGIALAVSPWGSLKLGRPDEKPAFDNISWFAMLFCAGMGTGFLFWGGAEPLLHFQSPPLTTLFPKEQALALTYFHWGLSPWAIYALTAVAIGYFCNRQELPLQFSRFLNCNKPWQRLLVDGFMILALIFGIAATFGMGVLMIEEGLVRLLGVPESALLKLTVIFVMTAVFLVSAYRGLSKGIRVLSNISLSLTCLLLLVMFSLMPKDGLWHLFSGSVGAYLQGLPGWSLGLGDFQPANWPRAWTVKYWSWWLAWAPFVGSFIALISKGRSVRQVLIGSIIAPTLFSLIWFFVMGDAAMSWIEAARVGASGSGLLGTGKILFNDAQSVWFGMLDHYTHSLPLALFSILMIGVFVCDSLDSASFTLSCLSRYPDESPAEKSSETLANEKSDCHQCAIETVIAHSENLASGEENTAMPEEGPFVYTFCWGIVLCFLTAALLLSGGIEILQEVTPIMVLPFSLLLLAVLGRFLLELFNGQAKLLPPHASDFMINIQTLGRLDEKPHLSSSEKAQKTSLIASKLMKPRLSCELHADV